ncbi:MAG: hypothetical protein J6R77_05495 [Clostridia bacterium]|nr:hypothetical protein [Clostridia bacterium]
MKKLCALLSILLVVAILAGLVGEVAPAISTKAEEPAYYVLDDGDTANRYSWQLDAEEKQQGRYSLRTSANGGSVELRNTGGFRLAVPENFGDWYLELWLYIDNLNRLTLRDCSLELAKNSKSYVRWRFNNMGLVKGWNRVQVKVNNANEKVGFDSFDEINQMKLLLKTTNTVLIRLDDICLVKEAVASDKSTLTATIAGANEVTADTLSGVAEELKQKFEAAKTRAAQVEASATASQRDVDVAATTLADAINALGFDGFTEDLESVRSYVDFAALTYSYMDNFKVVGGERTEYGGRKTTAFTDQLLLNPAAQYVGDAADVRFTFTYFDGEGGLELYAGTAEGTKQVLTVECAGSGKWKTATVRVRDAALARSVDGYDVSIKATGGNTAYVSRFETKLITAADLDEADPPAFQPETDVNNVLGASVFGYQLWFTATASQTGWVHWGEGDYPNPAPGNGNLSFDVYPYVQDYLDNGATLHKSNLGLLGNGSQSVLFTSKDVQIVETHFQWLEDYGLDCMAIQRFGFGDGGKKIGDAQNHLLTVQTMAEKYDKTFYVMYDVTGQGGHDSDTFYERMTNDWVLNVEQTGVASSTHYAHADGKPVVCIWGISGEDDLADNYPNGETATRMIRWFQERGYFVIVGTPDNGYATRTGDNLEPFTTADMISPWTVGRYDYNSVGNWLSRNLNTDLAFCEKYDVEYQPVIFPGFSWITMKHTGKPNAFPVWQVSSSGGRRK